MMTRKAVVFFFSLGQQQLASEGGEAFLIVFRSRYS